MKKTETKNVSSGNSIKAVACLSETLNKNEKKANNSISCLPTKDRATLTVVETQLNKASTEEAIDDKCMPKTIDIISEQVEEHIQEVTVAVEEDTPVIIDTKAVPFEGVVLTTTNTDTVTAGNVNEIHAEKDILSATNNNTLSERDFNTRSVETGVITALSTQLEEDEKENKHTTPVKLGNVEQTKGKIHKTDNKTSCVKAERVKSSKDEFCVVC